MSQGDKGSGSSTGPSRWRHLRVVMIVAMVGSALIGLHGQVRAAGHLSEFPVPTSNTSPEQIAPGPDGNLWFTDEGHSEIGRVTPSGTITEPPIPTSDTPPLDITAGPDGNLWATTGGGVIERITLSGTITKFRIPSSASWPGDIPGDITVGPDGNLWFSEYYDPNIGRITPSGIITEFPIPTVGAGVRGITSGPDGNLWFTEFYGDKIGRITPSGIVTEFSIPTHDGLLDGDPNDIAAGPDGNLWFTEGGPSKIGRITPSGTITEFPTPTIGSGPVGITAGPDGNLWFTEFLGDKIGRITPSGTITEFSITYASAPVDITAGPDHNLWFTEYLGNKIGRLNPPAPSPPSAIKLSPLSQSCMPPCALEVEATVTDVEGNPVPGIPVTFNVRSGPDKGINESHVTPSDGTAVLFVTLKTSGTDTVQASFTDAKGFVHVSNQVTLTATPCLTVSSAAQSDFHAAYAGWSVTGSVSARAGLTVNDLTLGNRYMASRISIPYMEITLPSSYAPHTWRRFRLQPGGDQYSHGTFVAHTELISPPRICQLPRDPHSTPATKEKPNFPPQPLDELAINADYGVWFDHQSIATPAPLVISQVYKFYAPFDENNHEYDLQNGLACEPSQEVGGVLSTTGLHCAKWKPLVFFTYRRGAGTQAVLPSITVPYLLNFAPDHKYVQGTVLIHDCNRAEFATRPHVCVPHAGAYPNDFTMSTSKEIVANVLADGHAEEWDNVHLTAEKHVGAPTRPPGCLECVHIHWRWGTFTLGLLPWNDDPRAKALYGDGKPLLCDVGKVNPTTNCNTDQTVDVALVNDRYRIENVDDFRSTVDGLNGQKYGEGNALGPYVIGNPKPNILLWYVATATKENHDVFFAHGGFFDTNG